MGAGRVQNQSLRQPGSMYTESICFRITRAQREYYPYRGPFAELDRSGYGSSRPELVWANRQKQQGKDDFFADPNKTVNTDTPGTSASN